MAVSQRVVGKAVSWLRSKDTDFYFIAAIIVLIPLSIYSVDRAYAESRNTLYDFEVFHVDSRLLNDGLNPYRVWEETPDLLESYALPRDPNNPDDTPLEDLPSFMLPLFLVIIYPLGWFVHNNAETVWFALGTLMAMVTAVVSLRLFDDKPRPLKIAAFILLLLAWYPTRMTLWVGQVTLFVTMFGLLALYFDKKERPLWAGICLGLALIKYTLSGPLVLYFILYRRWKILIAAALLNVAGLLAFGFITHESIFAVISTYRAMLSSTTPANSFPGAASLDGWLQLLGLQSFQAVFAEMVIGAVIGLILVVPRYWRVFFKQNPVPATDGGRLRQYILVILLVAMGLFFVYHRAYDFPFMIVFVAFALSQWLADFLADVDGRLLAALRVIGVAVAFLLLIPPSLMERLLVPPITALVSRDVERVVIANSVSALVPAITMLLIGGTLLWALYRFDRRSKQQAASPSGYAA